MRKLLAVLLLTLPLFAQDYDTAKQAITQITQPALTALDAYKATEDAQVQALTDKANSLQVQLTTLQQQEQVDQATVASLTQQLASVQQSLATAQQQLRTANTLLTAALDSISPSGFADLQMQGDWASHTDPSIGPWATGSTFTFAQFQKQGVEPYAMKLGVQGVSGFYSDILFSITRRPLPAPGKVVYVGRLWVDSNTATAAQAIEIDTIISKAGFRYNFSSQINVAKGWMLQISGETPWKDTGCIVGPLAAGQWHDFSWQYAWNDATHTYSFVQFTIDSTTCAIAASLQNMTATATTWGDSVHPQLQLDTNSKGIPFTVWYADLAYKFPQ